MSEYLCCPKDSCGAIKSDYKSKGTQKNLENDLPVYEIGNSENVVIVLYDIYGFE
jgi:hypothetical protein